MKFFYTYILKSLKDSDIYIGFTENLKERLAQHNAGKVESTRNRIPFELIYFEGCLKMEDAIKREKQLKTGFGRAYINRRISDLKK